MYDGGEEFMLVGKGNVHIFLGENMLIFLNVYYVPIMELNLLSFRQIMSHCPHLDVTFSNHERYIVDKETKKTSGLGVEDHGLLKLLDIRWVKEHGLASKSPSNISILWHQQYENLNFTYLSHYTRENLVDGLPDIQ
jgi:hypothetical protein